ncbi:alkaline phosphatase family protein [Duganella aquatilis]|uniref:alkaline phosphatase family protein n=1 Tax=Duganella aquatilis TaxID=2666082 RepID=UPI001AA0118E|nr:alkaline phosphatase family protein [Duganella aquatilis]
MKLKLSFALTLIATALTPAMAADRPHNVILFVPDGMRSEMVTAANAPAMAALRDAGVAFSNSHSVFPTFTTANASVFATGHYLGDTGDFSNTIHTGYQVGPANGSVTPFLENDAVLGDVDEHFSGDFLNQETVMKAARKAGFNTAAVGKLGPTLIFGHTDRSGDNSIIADDSTGSPAGIPLAQWVKDGLAREGLAPAAPSRGANGSVGSATVPGTVTAIARTGTGSHHRHHRIGGPWLLDGIETERYQLCGAHRLCRRAARLPATGLPGQGHRPRTG